MSNGIVTEEVWRAVPIDGLKDHYDVSTLGRVRRSAGGKGARAGRIINPGITAGGYCLVDLCTGGVEKCFYLHRLVAVTFIANPLGKPEVNHLSAEKTDNSVMNLDWATKRENAAHAAGMGLILHGEQVHTAKLTSERVAQIHTEIAGVKGHKRADKVRELAARFGVTVQLSAASPAVGPGSTAFPKSDMRPRKPPLGSVSHRERLVAKLVPPSYSWELGRLPRQSQLKSAGSEQRN